MLVPMLPAIVSQCAPPVIVSKWGGLKHTKIKLGTPPCINANAKSAKESGGTYYEFPAQKNTSYVIVLYDGHTTRTITVKHAQVLTERV